MAKAGKLPVAESAAALFAAQDIQEEAVDVAEWGVAVKVRALTRGQARKLSELSNEEGEAYALMHGLVQPSVSPEEAARLVNEKGFASTEKVLEKILDLSGLTAGFRP